VDRSFKTLTVIGGAIVLGREPDEARGDLVDAAHDLGATRISRGALDWSELWDAQRSQVSRQHAVITALDDALAIRNLSRTNATYVNGLPISGEVPLLAPGPIGSSASPRGAVLRIGEYVGVVVDARDAMACAGGLTDLSSGAAPEAFPANDERLLAGPLLRALVERGCRALQSAPRPSPTLLEGRTGSGKELIARVLHARTRAGRPFVTVNCAALPRGDVGDAELFGIVEGVATSVHERRGLFRSAHEGTLVLDEVQELPLELQAKLLRLVQDGTVQVVGYKRPESFPRVDVQLIAVTNSDLSEAVREGKFREDLLERFRGHVLRVPALAERREDSLPLALHFLSQELGVTPSLETQLAEVLVLYDWPRNVRQLKNEMLKLARAYTESAADHAGAPRDAAARATTLHRALLEGELRTFADQLTAGRGGRGSLPPSSRTPSIPGVAVGPSSARSAARRPDLETVRALLRHNRGNVREVARLLNVHPQRLYDWYPGLERDAAQYRTLKRPSGDA
jgi:DNA-binding NtrC family response regulator